MISPHRAALFIAVLGVLLCIALGSVYFHSSYFEPDTVSYLFQAKILAHGKLALPAPPEYGFSSSPHINILRGKWYSKYPFGNALMLTPGVLIGAPWFIPALVMGAALFLLYRIVEETYGSKIALLAAVLGLISPTTLGMGSTWFSEPVSRFYLALYLLGLIRTWKGGGPGWPLLSGFALGYAFNTRPIPAVAFGMAGAVLTLDWLIRSGDRAVQIKKMGIFLIPFALMLLVCFAWNTYFTGDPFKFTHNAAQPYDKIGFGKRSEGYDPDLEHAFVFTSKWAWERVWRHTLPCISFNALGWGYYRPDLLREGHSLWITLRALPLLLPLFLMLLPLVHPSRNRYDLLFLMFLLFNLAFYFFFYFEGSTWGITPVNARYYNETTLLGILPLVARGMFLVWGWLRRFRHPRLVRSLVTVALALLMFNTVSTYVLIAGPYQNWGEVYQKLPRLVKQENLHHAVVFIPNHRGAPIGDYPFQGLEQADIVYFKLGPSRMWRLTKSDWRQVYDQYFQGRNAYMYKDGRLQRSPREVPDKDR